MDFAAAIPDFQLLCTKQSDALVQARDYTSRIGGSPNGMAHTHTHNIGTFYPRAALL